MFNGATQITTSDPQQGGTQVVLRVTAPGAKQFALRTFNSVGLVSFVSNAAAPTTAPPPDDDTVDDDTAPDDDTVDDDTTHHGAGSGGDNGGCGC